MTKSFTQRQLDAIADFNWGSAEPARHQRSKVGKVAEAVSGEIDAGALAVDSAPADTVKPIEITGWH